MPDEFTLLDGARTLVRNGLMQSDLDANFFKILNLDTSNLNIGGGPISFPAQAAKWLKSYDGNTRLFTATQPSIFEVSGFPSTSGQTGNYLTNDGGTGLFWNPLPAGGGGGTDTYINVKSAPFNATGNGVTDDYLAINSAISAAGGRTVYFPRGTYYVSQNLVPATACTLAGDNPFLSIIKGNAYGVGALLTLKGGSSVQRLGFSGDAGPGPAPGPGPGPQAAEVLPTSGFTDTPRTDTNWSGILVANASAVWIRDCNTSNFLRAGILVAYSSNVWIQSCIVNNCGQIGIWIINTPRAAVMDTRISNCCQNGIHLANSQGSVIRNNMITSCYDYGLVTTDSDNSVVSGNIFQQNSVGALFAISPNRPVPQASFGYSISGNNFVRNYYGGAIISLSGGTRFDSNNLAENGQGAKLDTYTIEPGATVDATRPDTGYQIGDILTVVSAGGEPYKLMVTRMDPLAPGKIAWDGLMVIQAGTLLPPTNPCNVTGGSGTGALIVLTTSKIVWGGALYTIGQCLRSNNGTFFNPVRLMVTGVDGSGGITAYTILDGGGYVTAEGTLTFVPDSVSQSDPDNIYGTGLTGNGFELSPFWGKRYSGQYQNATTFGLQPLGAVAGAILSDNIIQGTRNGVGILFRRLTAPTGYDGYSELCAVTGNNIVNADPATFSIKSQTDNDPLADDINHYGDSIFANNIMSP